MSGVDGKLFSAGVEMITEPRPAARSRSSSGMSDAALRRIAEHLAGGWVPLVRGSLDPVATIERNVTPARGSARSRA